MSVASRPPSDATAPTGSRPRRAAVQSRKKFAMNRWSLRRSASSSVFSSLFRFSRSRPTHGVLVVHCVRENRTTGSVADDGPAVSPLGMRADLDDNRLGGWPAVGLMLDQKERSLRLAGLLVLRDGLLQQVVTERPKPRIHADSERVTQPPVPGTRCTCAVHPDRCLLGRGPAHRARRPGGDPSDSARVVIGGEEA